MLKFNKINFHIISYSAHLTLGFSKNKKECSVIAFRQTMLQVKHRTHIN